MSKNNGSKYIIYMILQLDSFPSNLHKFCIHLYNNIENIYFRIIRIYIIQSTNLIAAINVMALDVRPKKAPPQSSVSGATL
jgi:hypothetical protein